MVRRLLAAAAIVIVAASCTGEDATPIDLERSDQVDPTTPGPDPSNDVNADARAQVIELAEQQCRDDPGREFGVIVFADPETGEEVSRYEHPCDEVDRPATDG